MLNVELKDEQLTEVMQTALIQALGDKGKEVLLQSVVKYLTTPQQSYSGSTRATPIQEALNLAANQFASKYFLEKMETDTRFTDLIKDLYEEAYQNLLNKENKEKIVEAMSRALRKAIVGDGY